MSKTSKPTERRYYRVFITYNDGESSGCHDFKDRAKAERWAERQQRSAFVKKVAIEEFTPKRRPRQPWKQQPRFKLNLNGSLKRKTRSLRQRGEAALVKMSAIPPDSSLPSAFRD